MYFKNHAENYRFFILNFKT